MDLFFQDPSAIPLPPAEVRIKDLRAEPWPDGQRVRVFLEITPFQKRPSGEIAIVNEQGDEVASISIIETIVPRMEFTMHLRQAQPGGEYTLTATVFYPQESQPQQEAAPTLPDRLVVDQRSIHFHITACG